MYTAVSRQCKRIGAGLVDTLLLANVLIWFKPNRNAPLLRACRVRLPKFAQQGPCDPMVLSRARLHNDGLQALAANVESGSMPGPA